ncbi:hypothetical protein BDZ45DRAFT_741811 [Acephala macrosclerotiorum]|nr:hypothetical protein BDZ45DRAFT_741811 [Acephala macrosclerotiorum]
MAFQNQFSLSLELTKLVPLALAISGKTYEATMNLARDLQVLFPFGKRTEEALEDSSVRAAPSFELVRGMLQACDDQTALYDWRNQLLAVAAKLEFEERKIYHTIPEAILHSLISMLPLVQHFPEDRYIVIKTAKVACSIVVRASLLLGLDVLVRIYPDDKVKEVRFDSMPEQVLIEIGLEYENSPRADMKSPEITLLSSSTMEELFKLKSDVDEDMLSATLKRPARGFAKRILVTAVTHSEWSGRISQEMKLVSIAVAICIAKKLCITIETQCYPEVRGERFRRGSDTSHFRASVSSTSEQYTTPLPYHIQHHRILGAARILFNDEKLQLKLVEEEMNFEEENDLEDILWMPLRNMALQTSVLILAFAHITDMDSAADLQYRCAKPLICFNNLSSIKALRLWDGETQIPIRENVWLQIMALFMTGQSDVVDDLQGTSLLSNYGWSLFVNTFGASDSSYIDPGWVAVKRGVSWRKDAWKHRVTDGPCQAVSR